LEIEVFNSDQYDTFFLDNNQSSVFESHVYKDMMVVKDQEEEVLFLAKESGGKITEFLLIVSGGGDDALIAIQGDIDLESISSIASGLDMPGLENLEDLEEMP